MRDNLLRRIPILNLQLKKLGDTCKRNASWGKSEKIILSALYLQTSFEPSNLKIVQLKLS